MLSEEQPGNPCDCAEGPVYTPEKVEIILSKARFLAVRQGRERFDDYFQELCELGLRACARWKPDLGKFPTYIETVLRARVIDLHRKNIMGHEGKGDGRAKKHKAFMGRLAIDDCTTDYLDCLLEDKALQDFSEGMDALDEYHAQLAWLNKASKKLSAVEKHLLYVILQGGNCQDCGRSENSFQSAKWQLAKKLRKMFEHSRKEKA